MSVNAWDDAPAVEKTEPFISIRIVYVTKANALYVVCYIKPTETVPVVQGLRFPGNRTSHSCFAVPGRMILSPDCQVLQ